MTLLALPPLFGLAWLIAIAALDRDAELRGRNPRIAIPGQDLSAHLLLGQASEQLSRGNEDAANQAATAALAREPMNQGALRTLGMVARRNGSEDMAGPYMLLAAALGWRDPLTQVYWFNRARELGDMQVAAARLDAMMRIGWDRDYSRSALLEMERTPAGRAAMAALLPPSSPWREALLSDAARLTDEQLERRIALVRLLGTRGWPPDLSTIGRLSNISFGRGRHQEARQLWSRFASAGPQPEALVFDGGFESEVGANASPFVWRVDDVPGFTTTVEAARPPLSGHALRILSDTTISAPVVRQWLVLAPGPYRLAWREESLRGRSVVAQVSCKTTPTILLTMEDAAPGYRSYRFAIPPSGTCTAQRLILASDFGSLGGGETWIDDVSVTPID